MEKLNWAITGANGYVGEYLCNSLVEKNQQITRWVRSPAQPSDVRFVLGDEVDPRKFITANGKTDILIHTAYDFSASGASEVRRVNVEGSRKLFMAASDAGVKSVVFISSIAAFAGCKSVYGRCKLEAEVIAESYGAKVLRPGLIFGDSAKGMFGRLNALVSRGFPILPLFDSGQQLMYLVHIDDLCETIYLIAPEFSRGSKSLIAANSTPVPFRAILSSIALARGKNQRYIYVPSGLAIYLLKAAELFGINLGFRSDSLVSLLNTAPEPNFGSGKSLGLSFRKFELGS